MFHLIIFSNKKEIYYDKYLNLMLNPIKSCSVLQVRLAGEQEAKVRILPWDNVCLWSRYDPSSREETNKKSTKVFFLILFLTITGLLITYIALNLMDGHGQPALLYIVPFILGTNPHQMFWNQKLLKKCFESKNNGWGGAM